AQGTTIVSSRHQHLAIGQQRRRVIDACGAGAAGATPASRGWIVKLGPAQVNTIVSPRHQHLAIGQQRRRVARMSGAEAASAAPASSRRIIQLRAAQETATEYCLDP